MGGGMGLGQVVCLCVVIECIKMVMFEMCIGFLFDVGVMCFLSVMFFEFELYVGLMGVMFMGVDVLYCYLVDVCVFVEWFVFFEECL